MHASLFRRLAAVVALAGLVGCGTTASVAPSCARMDLPPKPDLTRVRCADGAQRYVAAGEVVSLSDVCAPDYPQPTREELAAAGATCNYAPVAPVNVSHPTVTLEIVPAEGSGR